MNFWEIPHKKIDFFKKENQKTTATKKTKKQTFDLFFNATINGDVKNRHVKFIEI